MTLTERLLDIANIGAEWVLWLLLAISLASVMVILERAAFFIKSRASVEGMRKRFLGFLARGQHEKAHDHFKTMPSMEAQVLSTGLHGYDLGPNAAGELMSGTLATEKIRYERNLGFLATVGSNTPFIGLFGTVLGIINAFAALDLSGGTEVDDRIMGAIAEALVATGVGLLVAIPAVVAFNLYRVRVKRSVANTEKLARTLVAHLIAEREQSLVAVAQPTSGEASEQKAAPDATTDEVSDDDPKAKKKAGKKASSKKSATAPAGTSS